ncbi:eCIS core domain-containing protein [Actinoplanes sp. CA-030573]|uniref:eCIS core domain-containing protein n=1 Tax=Actinoplanes sp. CA-030573 TaxID=3239898 RepID=UPI003D910CCB
MSDPAGVDGLRVLGSASLPPGNVPDPAGAVTVTPPRVEAASPRERWEAAIAARPLEAPRALPVALQPMASAISGRARPPLFTTGPNTRRALAAAGALGATTGTVVHLPSAPSGSAVSAVLAHELTHTRSPVRRPRFLLDGVSALLDDDERSALAAGAARAQSMGAGIVDSLPVGGGGLGGVSEVATRAARAAVIEAAGSPMGGAFGGLQSAAGGALGGLQSGAFGGLQSGAFGGLQSAAAGAQSAMQGAMSDVENAAGGAMSAVSESVGGAAHAAGEAVGGVAQGIAGVGQAVSGAAKALDPDQVVEIVERRLLREIERRGGRWAGVF